MAQTTNQYKKVSSSIKTHDDGYKYIFTEIPYIRSDNKEDYTKIISDYIHDGDTINVLSNRTFGIRFLGVDTAEVSIDYPSVIKPANLPEWYEWPDVSFYEEYLTDPFQYPGSEPFKQSLGPRLLEYLKEKFNSKAALNHQTYGDIALKKLQDIVKQDILNYYSFNSEFDFSFFMVFAFEVMDRYGRFLCFVDRTKTTEERQNDKLTYNEKLLQQGFSIPYFIWPNINPFRKDAVHINTLKDAIYPADQFYDKINADTRLSEVRKSVKDAQTNHLGIFSKENPLLIQPFELRYLFRRQAPDRYVLDMSSKEHPVLLRPTKYFTVAYEDRLFVDEIYLHLFKQRGYLIQGEN